LKCLQGGLSLLAAVGCDAVQWLSRENFLQCRWSKIFFMPPSAEEAYAAARFKGGSVAREMARQVAAARPGSARLLNKLAPNLLHQRDARSTSTHRLCAPLPFAGRADASSAGQRGGLCGVGVQ
jgi:hypothetical protein